MRILGKVDKRGVPVPAIHLSALVTLLCVVINYLLPGKPRYSDVTGGRCI